ncbi:MAG TPA: hypothetical protein VGJ73_10970 [Verrucomicrobiae bacterium]|jgi:hypothetical protein
MKKLIFKKLCAFRLAVCAASIVAVGDVWAQPYYTNTSQGYGVQQYNNTWTQPLQPSKTLAQQYQAGILAGTIGPSPWYLLTNSFTTNIYTTAPVITANPSTPSVGSNFVTVVSVTTSNFVLQSALTNQIVYWQAVGH